LIRLGLLCFGSVVSNGLYHRVNFFVFWRTLRMEVSAESSNSASVTRYQYVGSTSFRAAAANIERHMWASPGGLSRGRDYQGS
jgi:hypothetical protein